MHHVDRDTPWEEIRQAMEQLVREGKVIYVGSSNFAAWHLVQGQYEARARHLMGLVCEQSLYNLNARMIEMELIPVCRTSEQTRKLVEKYRPQLEAYEAFCRKLGEKPADGALAWLLHNPVVTGPIIGPRTLEQLEGSLRALEIQLSPETLHRLDEIFPGPGGEAPGAYAW